MKNLFSFLFLLLLSTSLAAQSPEILAKSSFLRADESYGNGDFTDAIELLQKAKEYLGETNPKIQALLVRSFVGNKDYEAAEKAIGRYFELADETDGDYLEMVKLVSEIKEAAATYGNKDWAWQEARRKNSIEGYELFMSQHPQDEQVSVAEDRTIRLRLIEVLRGDYSWTEKASFLVKNFNEGETFWQGDVEMVSVPSGELLFKLYGTDELPAQVNDFFISPYEVQIGHYLAFVKETGEKHFDDHFDLVQYNELNDQIFFEQMLHDYFWPVQQVSWYSAVRFCNWLSEKNGLKKVYTINGDEVTANWQVNGFRLPTAAEWEFAAGGASDSLTVWSGTSNPEELKLYANLRPHGWAGNKSEYITPVTGVGGRPNQLGLFHMTGNVSELCWTILPAKEYRKIVENQGFYNHPVGPEIVSKKSLIICKGGSFTGGINAAKNVKHIYTKARYLDHYTGFRVARSGYTEDEKKLRAFLTEKPWAVVDGTTGIGETMTFKENGELLIRSDGKERKGTYQIIGKNLNTYFPKEEKIEPFFYNMEITEEGKVDLEDVVDLNFMLLDKAE